MDVREKLLEAAEVLNHYRNRHYNESSATEEYKLAQAINDVLPTLAQVIVHGVTVQEWISVKDRLPAKDGYYLAFVQGYYAKCVRTLNFAKDGRKVDEFDFDEGDKNVWYRYDSEYGYVTVEDVTHWMPLPQPPKGE